MKTKNVPTVNIKAFFGNSRCKEENMKRKNVPKVNDIF